MNAREQKGLQIAALLKITHKGKSWLVPSQSGKAAYTVKIEPLPTCTCADYADRKEKCKHIYAAEFTMRREKGLVLPQQVSEIAARAKVKYRQNWPAYHKAQTEEKMRFQILLHELCSSITNPIQVKGRPRLSLADMIFSSVFRVYSTLSCRRFMSDLKDACAKGYIAKTPCHNSIFNYFEDSELTPYLYHLIAQSALPLKTVEVNFAVDSSGFRTQGYVRWFNAKYGREQENHDWLKAHVMTGAKTNIITAVEISDRHANDSPFFAPLVESTSERFTIKEASGDKAYSSRGNLRLVDSLGATPYIAFKDNALESKQCEIWDKLFHYYALHKEEFMQRYHKRSNVESMFWMIKSKFGEQVRSKLPVAQINEILCKVLCHNLCCVIQSTLELGAEATFWAESTIAQKVEDLPKKPAES